MDVDSLYKKVKAENNALIAREKDLLKRIDDIKRLTKQKQERQANVDKLEAELAKLLEALDS